LGESGGSRRSGALIIQSGVEGKNVIESVTPHNELPLLGERAGVRGKEASLPIGGSGHRGTPDGFYLVVSLSSDAKAATISGFAMKPLRENDGST
jgi:hypothetical protein